MNHRLPIVLVSLAATFTPVAAQDAADRAWTAGNQAVAESLYTIRLAADSSDELALHRLGLIRAWNERYTESLQLFDRLAMVAPYNLDARIDRARVRAWRGNLDDAIDDLDTILEENPGNLRALEAQAQFAGWAGETDRALAAYDQIIELTPDDPSIRRNQAMVLMWAARHDEARVVYDSILAQDPNDADALMALGQMMSWSGQLDSAAALYRTVLERDPRNIQAMQGEARTVTWSGDLVEGEARWRRTLAVEPDNVITMVGLAQTLRWQSRPGAALDLLYRALRLSPNDRDVLTQLRWTESVTRPRATTTVTQESDSDGNRVLTTAVRAAWRPTPSVQLTVDAYRRSAAFEPLRIVDAASGGATVTVLGQLEPGWRIAGALGVSGYNGSDQTATIHASVSTPPRNPLSGTLRFARSAFDYTQPLIASPVRLSQVEASGRARLGSTVSLGGALGYAVFDGSESNPRWNVGANVTKRVHPHWTVGLLARTFGYREDLADGYFDPSYFGIGEVLARWARTFRAVSIQFEAAPGLQQVRSVSPRVTARGSARLGYLLAPGREISVHGAYSSAGLQNITTAASDYRYYALSFSASWLF